MTDRLPKILRTRGAVERGRDTVGPDLSAAEAAVVARFDAAPDADEALRERVARAMFRAAVDASGCIDEDNDDIDLDDYRRLADAAIAICRGDA